MRKMIVFAVAISLILGSGLLGCMERASSAQDAIDKSKSYNTPEDRAEYLIAQADAFLKDGEFDEARKTSGFVLRNHNKNSEKAKSILAESKAELAKSEAESK